VIFTRAAREPIHKIVCGWRFAIKMLELPT